MIRAIDKWFIPWLRSARRLPQGRKHLLFCVADHFEPFREGEDCRLQTADCRLGEGDGGRRTEEAKVSGLRSQVSGLNFDAKYRKEEGEGGAGGACETIDCRLQTEDHIENTQGPNQHLSSRRHELKNPTTEQPTCPAKLAERRRSNSTTGGVGDVRRWTECYREALGSFKDADGMRPRHTFFYPAEDYDHDCIDHLAGFCREGLGEVEVQLHHRNDTPDGFCEKIELFKEQLAQHGLLGMDQAGRRRFGFVHGNWALCNSRPDGDWCGVNEELGLLQKLGCYADFTFPSAPSPTQPRMVNCIYRAVDQAGSPGGCDAGVRSQVAEGFRAGVRSQESGLPPSWNYGEARRFQVSDNTGLMLITGPVGLRWDGLRPRLENSALTWANMPSAQRIRYWVNRGICVEGRPDWVFVKVHMHGLNESESLITGGMKAMHGYMQEHYNDGGEWCLHYVTAREMYNIARAAEEGKDGDPGKWRDFEVAAPG